MPLANVLQQDGFQIRSKTSSCTQVNLVASEAIKRGDIVKFSSEQAAQAISAPSAGSLSLTGGGVALVGIALGDAASGDTVAVAVADDNLEFHVRIMHGTASSAEQQDVTIGTAYQAGRYTTSSGGVAAGSFYGIGTTTTNGELVIVEKSLASAASDDYGWVWVKVVPAYRALK